MVDRELLKMSDRYAAATEDVWYCTPLLLKMSDTVRRCYWRCLILYVAATEDVWCCTPLLLKMSDTVHRCYWRCLILYTAATDDVWCCTPLLLKMSDTLIPCASQHSRTHLQYIVKEAVLTMTHTVCIYWFVTIFLLLLIDSLQFLNEI